ncbi:tRNA (adenosine(37)-N6)-threonylcarbamoyltransferase complex dimerization subunit type 1 TsaB [Henriciella marina]|jgi:tRNA threonylcarbamoyladenosine biosynthesis protein TsaB|uniref:tRNA (Adenosine(37)-N6)-threonylcarbamoyltransferase complex dimerization subunit type 1 TsaB n=1 Tax=Henriciella marina TaxID=453851 RepID=A0ABT4LUS5_9PROT|nr:tRNA (adenosine(37)-N6)-threonylcarbamoyltransferase complex dimerization subunit type 1 TsaB [Henriciella marina]MCZ4297288.1 tRNA (adenosine(37)-N6)-threonylcarbamoyltransferase complex dimerization subunit type 1 TsaB [Henriciella marina]
MLILGINTSGPACDVAVVQAGSCLSERREEMVRGQDARLPAIVAACMDDAGYTLQDIDRIGVVTGPGSFTGIRVGVAFARGLSLALKVPCIGVTALEAALPAGQQGSAIVALPAKRRPPDLSYWVQRFRTGAATGEPEELGLDAIKAELGAHPHFVYGETDGPLGAALESIDIHEAHPSARRTAEFAYDADDASTIARPVYVRAPDAALPGGRKL